MQSIHIFCPVPDIQTILRVLCRPLCIPRNNLFTPARGIGIFLLIKLISSEPLRTVNHLGFNILIGSNSAIPVWIVPPIPLHIYGIW